MKRVYFVRIPLLLALLLAFSLGLAVQPALAYCGEEPGPGVDWSGCDKSNIILDGVDLSGADLTETDLTEAILLNVTLTNATMINANLRDADLTNSNLTNADLSGAGLTYIILNGANLSNANLSGAYLSGSNLTNANLSGANLTNADLSSANLLGATGQVPATNRAGVIYNNTTCPSGAIVPLNALECWSNPNPVGLLTAQARPGGAPWALALAGLTIVLAGGALALHFDFGGK